MARRFPSMAYRMDAEDGRCADLPGYALAVVAALVLLAVLCVLFVPLMVAVLWASEMLGELHRSGW